MNKREARRIANRIASLAVMNILVGDGVDSYIDGWGLLEGQPTQSQLDKIAAALEKVRERLAKQGLDDTAPASRESAGAGS